MDINIPSTSNMDLNWRKIEKDMTKVGLRDGLSDGRDLHFQESFDKGYEDGFHNAFILGNLKFQSEQEKKLETSHDLKNAANVMCIVCTDEKENEDVDDVRRKQVSLINLNVEKIKSDLEIASATT